MMMSSIPVESYVHKVTAEEAVYPPIETWENLNPQRDYIIKIDVHEFTSVCPKTGLPDFGKITIEYIPDDKVIELKAFKYYMLAYRNVGMFYENITNKILTDIVEAIHPRWVKVHSDFSTRGGISTEAVCVFQQEGYTKPAYLG
ncbi:MAG: preQ(1) synthase [Vampirovibrionales bacterium]